jgi:hypothetical protein
VITRDRLNHLLTYDPETGNFTFLPRADCEFATPRAAAIFRAKCEGKVAGWRHSAGYISIKIDGAEYLAHRLAWLWHTGQLPDDEIDHINGNRADNRLANLREVTKLENSHNQSLRVTNTSGTNGVFPSRGRWRAEIVTEGKSVYLGEFRTQAEGVAARRGAEKILGFHRGHGKARTGDYYKPRHSVPLPKIEAVGD